MKTEKINKLEYIMEDVKELAKDEDLKEEAEELIYCHKMLFDRLNEFIEKEQDEESDLVKKIKNWMVR